MLNNGVRLVTDNDVDFERYAKAPPEAAKVRTMRAYQDELIARISDEDFTGARRKCHLPWGKTHALVGIRPGEVSVWAGANGSGKSVLTGEVALFLAMQSERICIASFEMRPAVTAERMLFQCAGSTDPSILYAKHFCQWADNKIWFYDQQGSVKAERIVPLLRYLKEEHNVTQVFIDSLMKCGIGVDDWNGQKRFVDSLCAHARDSGQHVHLICHSKKSESEFDRADKMSIKGTSEITDLVDNVFIHWRNKRKEDEKQKDSDKHQDEPDALLSVSKQRNGRWEGQVALYYDKGSMQYTGDSSGKRLEIIPDMSREPGSDDE